MGTKHIRLATYFVGVSGAVLYLGHTYLDMVEEKRYEERPELANLSIGRKRKVQYRAGTN